MERIENKEICKNCGGKCCKKCGCDYFIQDIKSFKLNDLLSLLESGNISIVAAMDFTETKDRKLLSYPILYLRARNKNRNVIDLISMKTECSMLTETGCSYTLEKRPGAGAGIIPRANGKCGFDDPEYFTKKINEWLPYQRVLSKIVKRLTGKTVNEKIKEDIKELIIRCLKKDFTDVSDAEIEDLKDFIPLLIRAYPGEAEEAKDSLKGSPILKRRIQR